MLKQNRKFDFKRDFNFITAAAGRTARGERDVWWEGGDNHWKSRWPSISLAQFRAFLAGQLEKGSGVARKTKKRERRRRMDSVPLLLLLLGRVLAS